MKVGIAAFLALTSFALACLCASLPPVSECSTPNEVALLPALICLGVFGATGIYATLRGGATERLIFVAGIALIMAAYVLVLSLTLPIAIETGRSCAGQQATVEQPGAGP